MRKRIVFIAAIAFLLNSTAPALADFDDEQPRYRIRMGLLDFEPSKGARATLLEGQRHLVVQFYEIPDAPQRRVLEERGVRLLRYINGNAYVASISDPGLTALAEQQDIRSTVNISREMRISPLFDTEELLRQRIASGQRFGIAVRFYEDVDFTAAALRISASGASTEQASFHYSRIIQAEADWASVLKLAAADEVDFIDPQLPPPIPLNEDTRTIVNAADVYKNKQFKRVTGKGVKVGIWDAGPVYNHMDFGGRITNVETANGFSDHSTHVAGTIAGGGKGDPEAMGMAAKASVYSFDFDGDPIAEMKNAQGNYGLMISSNSWSYVAGWYENEGDDEEDSYFVWLGLTGFGYYHMQAGYNLDKFVYQDNFPIVWAASNDRNDTYLGPHRHSTENDTEHEDLHQSDPDYESIPWWGNAKNNICVGAIMKDYWMTSFSGWGPTDDGRLKPDVVAPGFQLRSTVLDNQYAEFSGTSMATPVVTGVASLLIHYYNRLGIAPADAEALKAVSPVSADLLKALLIHTAKDLGREGPDFSYGYGMVDAELAATVLKGAAGENSGVSATVIGESLDNKKKKKYLFTVPSGAEELRVTLVWNDPPGPNLINDLDLWVRGGGKKYRPFTLDPSKPENIAVGKRNHRDNVEHVLVRNPKAGQWKVYVKGSWVPQGPQDFVLIISAGEGNDVEDVLTTGKMRVEKVITSSDSDWNSVAEKQWFNKGDKFWAYLHLYIDDNAKYDNGGYYGTVLARWLIKDSSGNVILKSNYSSDAFYPRANVWRWRLGEYEIPDGMPAGTYTVEVTVTMHNGAGKQVTTSFTVN